MAWTVASDLPSRLRVCSEDLVGSPALRHRCRHVLFGCHWLLQFRINPLAGSLCINYPQHRRRELLALLEQALNPAVGEQDPAPLPAAPFSGLRVRRALIHGTACLVLISLESALALPPLVIGGMATILLLPMAGNVLLQLRRRQLPEQSLELGFSGLLVSQGLTAEALLDLALGDAVEVAQTVIEREDLELDADHLLQRLAQRVSLQAIDARGQLHQLRLGEVEQGSIVRINRREHILLSARLLSGQLVVVNRLVDGDWRPRRLVPGERLEPGSLVISGTADATVEHSIQSDPAYGLLREHQSMALHVPAGAERWLQRYTQVMTPLLLGVGSVFLSQGSTEAALAAFQFNPLNDWEQQKLASQLTTIADLKLHKLTLRHPRAILDLGRVRHLFINRSCIDQIGAIQVRERICDPALTSTGSLVQLLAGIQHWISGTDGLAIWSRQLQNVANPVEIKQVEFGQLHEGWTITASDGRRWRLRQQAIEQDVNQPIHHDPLEIWQQDVLLGTLELLSTLDRSWPEACHALQLLGVESHLVSTQSVEHLDDVASALGIDPDHCHGSCSGSDRLELVRRLQQRGEAVAYLGYVLPDLPAMAQADVSISLDLDEESRYLAGISDLALDSDPRWLPRLINISRRMQGACNQNLGLLGGTQLIASLATAAGWIAPLQTVMLSDIPLLLAELNNVLALQAPRQPVAVAQLPTCDYADEAAQGS